MPKPLPDLLPPAWDRLIRNIERRTGRVPLKQALGVIAVVGLLLTVSLMGAMAWLDARRTARELDADASRIQLMIQDRIDHHAVLVEQVAALAAEHAEPDGSPPSQQQQVWSAQGVSMVPMRDWTPPGLADLLAINAPTSAALLACLQQANADALSMCAQWSDDPEQSEGLFLIRAIQPAQRGWVVLQLRDAELLRVPLDQSEWQLTVEVNGGGAPRPGLGGWQAHRDLSVAGKTVSLWLAGTPRPREWFSVLQHQAGMWVTGLAGLLCTLGSMHVYLLLITTRRRAMDLAKDMSAALQRTQSRNQSVMDTAPDAILITDEAGCVSWCNQATTSIFGQTLAELLGRPIDGILPVLGARSLAGWFSQHGVSDRVIGFETAGRRKEGTPFPVAMSASRTEREGERIHTFIVRDTTDAKWAEQELGLRDRALASCANGVIIVSMTLPNQPVIYVNQAFEAITGYLAHEVLGLNCRFLQGDESEQSGVLAMREAIAHGRACQVVIRNYRKNGSLFYNEMAISPVRSADGTVTHYVGVQNDITDRIAADQVLRLRTERLYAVFELSPDGFVVLDKRGEVSIVNPAFERMTGLLAADLVGQSQGVLQEQLMLRCKPVDAEASAAQGQQELLCLHTPCARTLMRRVRQGGHDEEVVMYFRDITHELEVDRMKSEFLSMAAHELRTPMASIFGFTELLLARPFDEARRKDVLTTIHRQSQVLINLINELLDLARIESRRGKDFKRHTQALQPIMEATLAGLLVQNDARRVACALPTEPILIDVDREKFVQALTNVLSNAYKYSPGGGDITLDVVWRVREGQKECGVRVSDHGLGMKPEHLARVFERFFRAESSGNIPGTGLGMTIVREIVELHGGQVTVDSVWGAGTVVVLWLPVRADLTVPETPPMPLLR